MYVADAYSHQINVCRFDKTRCTFWFRCRAICDGPPSAATRQFVDLALDRCSVLVCQGSELRHSLHVSILKHSGHGWHYQIEPGPDRPLHPIVAGTFVEDQTTGHPSCLGSGPTHCGINGEAFGREAFRRTQEIAVEP